MSGKITIGSAIPKSPLIKLKEITCGDGLIIRENGDIKGLYIVDLDA